MAHALTTQRCCRVAGTLAIMVQPDAGGSESVNTFITAVMLAINFGTALYLALLYVRLMKRRHAEVARRVTGALRRRLSKSPTSASTSKSSVPRVVNDLAFAKRVARPTDAASPTTSAPSTDIVLLPSKSTKVVVAVSLDSGSTQHAAASSTDGLPPAAPAPPSSCTSARLALRADDARARFSTQPLRTDDQPVHAV